jgi:hypothetical protein
MNKKIFFLVLAIPLLFLSACSLDTNRQVVNNNEELDIVGDDRDEHGCIASAGYTWCELKEECLRPWEEECGFIDVEEFGVKLNVFDGFEVKTSSSSEKYLLFGPKIEEEYLYTMEVFNKVSPIIDSEGLLNNENIKRAPEDSEIENIGDFEVFKWSEKSDCGYINYIKVMGINNDYLFYNNDCAEGGDHRFLEETIEDLVLYKDREDTVSYKNDFYGFELSLPKAWEDYVVSYDYRKVNNVYGLNIDFDRIFFGFNVDYDGNPSDAFSTVMWIDVYKKLDYEKLIKAHQDNKDEVTLGGIGDVIGSNDKYYFVVPSNPYGQAYPGLYIADKQRFVRPVYKTINIIKYN